VFVDVDAVHEETAVSKHDHSDEPTAPTTPPPTSTTNSTTTTTTTADDDDDDDGDAVVETVSDILYCINFGKYSG